MNLKNHLMNKTLMSALQYAKHTNRFEILEREDLKKSLIELTMKKIIDLIHKINDWIFSNFIIHLRKDLSFLRFS